MRGSSFEDSDEGVEHGDLVGEDADVAVRVGADGAPGALVELVALAERAGPLDGDKGVDFLRPHCCRDCASPGRRAADFVFGRRRETLSCFFSSFFRRQARVRVPYEYHARECARTG